MDFLDKENRGHFSTASKYEAMPDKIINQFADPLFTIPEYERKNLKNLCGNSLTCSSVAFMMIGRRNSKVEASSGEDIASAIAYFGVIIVVILTMKTLVDW